MLVKEPFVRQNTVSSLPTWFGKVFHEECGLYNVDTSSAVMQHLSAHSIIFSKLDRKKIMLVSHENSDALETIHWGKCCGIGV